MARSNHELFQTFEKGGKTGASSNSDHPQGDVRAGCSRADEGSGSIRLLIVDFGGVGRERSRARIGIQQLSEARILRKVLKIGIVASLEADRGLTRIASSRLRRRIFDVSREAVECRESIHHVVRLRKLLLQFVEMFAGSNVVSDVHQRYGIVEMLFGRLELCGGLFQMLVAGVEMNGGTVREIFRGAAHHF